jgi:hypothetical protein
MNQAAANTNPNDTEANAAGRSVRPRSFCRVLPVSASLRVCIKVNLLTSGALSVQDAQNPSSFEKKFFILCPFGRGETPYESLLDCD